MSWTGISATLRPKGRTVHSTFHLSSSSDGGPAACSIKTTSDTARLLQATDIFFIDEASMIPKDALQAIEKAVADVVKLTPAYHSDRRFGGKIFVLGGDFRQTLPIVPHGSPAQTIATCIKNSPIWKSFNVYHLATNMRTGPEELQFSDWLIRLGNGQLPSIDDEIEIPKECLTNEDLVDVIFGKEIDITEVDELASKVILCPTNADALEVNHRAIERIPGT